MAKIITQVRFPTVEMKKIHILSKNVKIINSKLSRTIHKEFVTIKHLYKHISIIQRFTDNTPQNGMKFFKHIITIPNKIETETINC